jgi:hypothetical protein
MDENYSGIFIPQNTDQGGASSVHQAKSRA